MELGREKKTRRAQKKMGVERRLVGDILNPGKRENTESNYNKPQPIRDPEPREPDPIKKKKKKTNKRRTYGLGKTKAEDLLGQHTWEKQK